MRRWDVIVTHEKRQRFGIHLGLELRIGAQCFQFGTEKKNAAIPAIIERFFPGTIARQIQAVLPAVPHSEREHPDEFLQCSFNAMFAKGCEHHFGVGVTTESVAGSFEIRFELLETIDFTVKNQNVAAISRAHWLMPL